MPATVVQSAAILNFNPLVSYLEQLVLPAPPTPGNILVAAFCTPAPQIEYGNFGAPWTVFRIVPAIDNTIYLYKFVTASDVATLPPLSSAPINWATYAAVVWEIAGATNNFLDSILSGGDSFSNQGAVSLTTDEALQDDELALLFVFMNTEGGSTITISPGWIVDFDLDYPSKADPVVSVFAAHKNYNQGDTPLVALTFFPHSFVQLVTMPLIKKLLDTTIITITTSISLPCTPCLTLTTGYVV